MAEALTVACSELILGGQKSGKSRRAENLAAAWLAQSPDHRAVLIATAEAHDDEMRARIARHQRERAARVPGLRTLEARHDLPTAIAQAGGADTLHIVDCLTLWLTNLMFSSGEAYPDVGDIVLPELFHSERAHFLSALAELEHGGCDMVLVSNEVGMGIVPYGAISRCFTDEAGRLNQAVAATCERAVFVAAGLPLYLKGGPC